MRARRRHPLSPATLRSGHGDEHRAQVSAHRRAPRVRDERHACRPGRVIKGAASARARHHFCPTPTLPVARGARLRIQLSGSPPFPPLSPAPVHQALRHAPATRPSLRRRAAHGAAAAPTPPTPPPAAGCPPHPPLTKTPVENFGRASVQRGAAGERPSSDPISARAPLSRPRVLKP